MMNMNGAMPPQQPPASPIGPMAAPPPPPPQPVEPGMLFQAQETLKKPTWDDVIARLRDDRLRSFTIDIETDSTIAADEEKQKQTVSEFLTNMGGFLTSMMPIVQQSPEFGPFAVQMMKFTSRRFEAGREMEAVIDETGDKLLERLANPPPTPPDPKIAAAQAVAQAAVAKGQAQVQVEQQKAQAEVMIEGQKAQSSMALRQAQAEADHQLEMAKATTDAQIAAVKAMNQPVKPMGGA